ncbi:Uncharacterised protein [uncultured archaeon]|nr:Uncharacterised protein [uncultured archaeon]
MAISMDTRVEILEAIRDEGEIPLIYRKHNKVTLKRIIDENLVRQLNEEKYELTEKGIEYLGIRENYRDRKKRR